MKALVRHALTQAEAEGIRRAQRMEFEHPLVDRIVKMVKIHAPTAAVTPKSYARVEQKCDGHDWHCDTGNMGHMKWCAYSASVLLTQDFMGGYFEFEDGEKHRHYLDMLTFSSDVIHRVLPHGGGDRLALLVFLGKAHGE